MASDKQFVDYVAGQIKRAGNITSKMMFGEYSLFSDKKIFALICDNILYLKPTDAGREFIGKVSEAPPYPGAKPCFVIKKKMIDDEKWLSQLVRLTLKELPAPKPKKKKNRGII